MDEDLNRRLFDGGKFTIVRHPGGIPPVSWTPEPEDIVAEYEYLALPDGTWAVLKDGEVVETMVDWP
jgi:hypothetical protein